MTRLIFLFLLSFTASAHELVLDHDFPDPSIIKAKDNFYYAYATQGYSEKSSPQLMNLQIAKSKDLLHWTHLGEALPQKPAWASNTQRFWAPHIHFANDLYYLYYSAEPNTLDGLCLAVATSKDPSGPFVDSGRPMACGPSFSNIDPMFYKGFLYWGSGFDPIRARKLSPSLLTFEEKAPLYPLVSPSRESNPAPYTRLFEGAWILKRDNYYYLFVSGEDCCTPPTPQYAVLVMRSKNMMGPFAWKHNDPRESVVIESAGRFSATGHNAFITDEQGQLWSFHHGVDQEKPVLTTVIPGDRLNRRILLRSKINFVNGWPVSE